MIAFLRGTVAELADNLCALDVNGVGYAVYISTATRSRLKPGDTALLYTFLAIKENDIALYGFDLQADYRLFRQLITVKGIGPTAALNILSAGDSAAIVRAICNQQLAALTALPGIGKKTAERLLLELKDKLVPDDLGGFPVSAGPSAPGGFAPVPDEPLAEALAALTALGYSQPEASAMLRRVPDFSDTADLVRKALKARS